MFGANVEPCQTSQYWCYTIAPSFSYGFYWLSNGLLLIWVASVTSLPIQAKKLDFKLRWNKSDLVSREFLRIEFSSDWSQLPRENKGVCGPLGKEKAAYTNSKNKFREIRISQGLVLASPSLSPLFSLAVTLHSWS